VILADGLPAESYLDTGNRTGFANGGAFVEAHPDFQPNHWAQTCLPLEQHGPTVARARACLLTRLVERGHEIVCDADPHLLADGVRIDPIRLSVTRLGFILPEGRRKITLRSRTFVPAHMDSEATDSRELGLCIGRLFVDGEMTALSDAGFSAIGWRGPEWVDGRFGRRWTSGAAELPAGARFIIVDLAGAGSYWREGERESASSAA